MFPPYTGAVVLPLFEEHWAEMINDMVTPLETLDLDAGNSPITAGAVEVPPTPTSLSQVGIRQSVLEDLALKILFLSGPFSVYELSRQLRLRLEVTDEIFRRLRTGQFCEVTGMHGNVANIAITSQGRSRALELLSMSQYAGAAPVPLEAYVQQVRKQTVRNLAIHAADVERAFAHLVVDDKTLWQVGTALNSGSTIFIHGPTGVGKTTIAETLSRVIAEHEVWIPFAIEVDGQIISVYDPLVHKSSSGADHEEEDNGVDRRWIRCRRPAVVVGGELTVEMLELQFNPATKFYTAPLQMKANNGVLIIDDFGRQRMRPEELLSRWIVPLDRGIDFLNLAGGKNFEIPFEMVVVFSTNMDPSKLMDDAFLRRIQTKIKINAVSEDQFREIFRRVAAERGLECDTEVLSELIEMIRSQFHEPLRPCYPRDIVGKICSAARYEDKEPHLDRTAVMRAVESYFLTEL